MKHLDAKYAWVISVGPLLLYLWGTFKINISANRLVFGLLLENVLYW